jgi:uncharacterized membrane protein YccC
MAGASTPTVPRLKQRGLAGAARPSWLPVRSKPAAIRAVRAAVVMPSLFVITEKVIGNPQMALFAAFGSFATLVLVGFAGTARDKLVAHLVLALAGSVLLTIGTAVSSSTVLAALITVPATFPVFFAGVAGPNAASGVTGALLAYVLPAATAGTMAQVPDRLAGWWLASVVGTLAVLVVPTPQGADRLGRAARNLCETLALDLERMLAGEATESDVKAAIAARHELMQVFDSTPYRPTGLALPDEALANAVELLEWCGSLLADMFGEHVDLHAAEPSERELVERSATVLRQCAALFAGGREQPEVEQLDACRTRSVASLHTLAADGSEEYLARMHLSFHTHALATAVIGVAVDAMLSARLVGIDWLSEAGSRLPAEQGFVVTNGSRRAARLHSYSAVAARHTSLRSVWFINSMRGALALAAAVAVAGFANAQHGFWVVLGTLSVLRASAAATGAIALRALLGTAVGFVIGGLLVLAIGSDETALWLALPIAVLVAAYSPGTAPFAVGQAAFTVTVIVLFNILVPVGWKVGELRIEDVALGCAVSVLVGIVFWPRGIASVVGDDLADAYRTGVAHLKEASDWVCGLRRERPEGAAASMRAGLRLDEALRGLLADRGTKHLEKHELWRLVGGSLRLRLTAQAVAELPHECAGADPGSRGALGRRVELLAGWYDELAALVGRPASSAVPALAPPSFDTTGGVGAAGPRQAVWLRAHLDHLVEHLSELIAPATRVAEIRRRRWWQ